MTSIAIAAVAMSGYCPLRVRVRNTTKAIAIAAVVAGGALLDIVRCCYRSSTFRVRVFAFVWFKVVSQHCLPGHCCT